MAWDSDYFWPFDGKIHVPIEGDLFGSGRDQGVHDGHDFIGDKPGTSQPFYAVHGGTVQTASDYVPGWSQATGSMIVIEDDGMQWVYQEFKTGSIKVKVGDHVKGGQKLGEMGRSGGAGTGEHLHIGMSKDVWHNDPYSTNGWYDVGVYLGIPNKVGVFSRPSNIKKPGDADDGSGGLGGNTITKTNIMINIFNDFRRGEED